MKSFTKKDLAEKMKKGLSKRVFLDRLEEGKESIRNLTDTFAQTSVLDALVTGTDPLDYALAAFNMGIDSMVTANLTFEEVMEVVKIRYDEVKKLREEFLHKAEHDPSFANTETGLSKLLRNETEELLADMASITPAGKKAMVH